MTVKIFMRESAHAATLAGHNAFEIRFYFSQRDNFSDFDSASAATEAATKPAFGRTA